MKERTRRKGKGYLDRLEKEFDLPYNWKVDSLKDFHRAMEQGLKGRKSSLPMLPSFLSRPTGREKGCYWTLDLGGTYVRVLDVALDGAGEFSIVFAKRFAIPRKVMHGSGEGLFDFLADCLLTFCREHPDHSNEERALAFTFSFPTDQHSVNSGTLICWTKGFTTAGVVGEDVVVLLQEGLKRKGLRKVRPVVLVNDTVATLMAGAYAQPTCDLGVILGTGTNACYPERIERIGKLPSEVKGGEMIINLEWGHFDGLKRNRFDAVVDNVSPNPGRQLLEKMVSAMYLGELVRLMLVDLTEAGILPSELTRGRERPFSLSSEEAARLAEGETDGWSSRFRLKKEEGQMLSHLSRLVFDRSARIAATAVAAILTWMDPALTSVHTVSVDGALFANNPFYQEEMRRTLREVLGAAGERVELLLLKDGSGIGSAVAAAVAERD